MNNTNHIIGREKEIELYWKFLIRKSLVLNSIRRMGKTSILQKMEENPVEGWIPVFHIVQGDKSPEEFVQRFYQRLCEIELLKPGSSKVRDFYNKWLGGQKVSGFELPNLNQHWKEVLEKIIEDLAEKEDNILIMLDEFPWMLYHFIIEYDKAQECMELLDVMRSLRVKYEQKSGIRFIFCGSIGFDVVLEHLTRTFNYLGNPTNNMRKEVLEEMNFEDAFMLCQHLSNHRNMTPKEDDLFHFMIKETNGLPFYIDLLFEELEKKEQMEFGRKEVEETLQIIVKDISGNGSFDHFRERIDSYYIKGNKDLAYEVLGILCEEKEAIGRKEIFQKLAHLKEVEEKRVGAVLKELVRDLYLTVSDDKQYEFRYTLIKRWWRFYYT